MTKPKPRRRARPRRVPAIGAVIPVPPRRPHTVGETLTCRYLARSGDGVIDWTAAERALAEEIDGALSTVLFKLSPKATLDQWTAVLHKIVRGRGGTP